jgi:hypothetical protein
MALNPIMFTPKPAKGGIGGSLGSILGGAVGAVGGAIAGGPMGAISGASLGSSLGGVSGGAIDPGKPGEAGSNIPISNAVDKPNPLDRMANDPEVQLAGLQTASKALKTESSIATPDAQALQERIALAQDMLKKRLS